MEPVIEEIKRKIDIVEYLGGYLTLKKAGRNFKANCPFHREKTPSFVISPERQIWHCFGACQEGGDIVKFLMKWENLTFIEAVRELAEKAGVKIKRFDVEDQAWKKKDRLVSLNQMAAEFFSYVLHKTKFGKKAIDYLEKRKLKSATIKQFELGYAPSSWDSLRKFLMAKKFTDWEGVEAGLLIKSDSGRIYDRFRGRLMFPIKDARGVIVGFSGRTLDPAEKAAKYVNTPETPLYHKRESLFGIHLAKEAIKKEKNAIITEGEFDMITPYQLGVTNIVAIKGSALTREQLYLLKRYTNRINLALDADSAGEEAIRRGIEEAEVLEFEIGVIIIGEGKDPDEAARKDPTKFKEAIKKPQPIYDFIINLFQKKYPGDDPFSKKNIAEGVVPFFGNIRNPIVRSYVIRKLAELLSVDERSIEALIRKQQREKFKPVYAKVEKKEKQEINRELMLQKYLLSSIFQHENCYRLAEKATKIIDVEDLTVPSHKKIFKLFLTWKENNKDKFTASKFHDSLSAELKPVFDEIYLFSSAELGIEEQSLVKIAYELKKDSLKKQMSNLVSLGEKITPQEEKVLKNIGARLTELEKLTTKL